MGIQVIPALALGLLPALACERDAHWPDSPDKALFAAQIEQETCITLKHPKCWNPKAELRTSREIGFGLGQLTVTKRFDNFAAARGWDKSLADWRWSDRHNPRYQMRALVVYDRNLYRQVRWADGDERFAFALSAYNGGMGGVIKDTRLCAATTGCDRSKWFGNVERTSLKARTAVKGYGKSFYQINREYVVNVMRVRPEKYRSLQWVCR